MKKIMLMATMMVATLTASAQYDAGTWSLNVRYGFTGATMINTPDMDLSLALGPGSTINLPGGDLEASATGGHVVGLELENRSEDEGKHYRCHRVTALLHVVCGNTGNDHDLDIEDAVSDRIGTNDTDSDDDRCKYLLGNLEDSHQNRDDKNSGNDAH